MKKTLKKLIHIALLFAAASLLSGCAKSVGKPVSRDLYLLDTFCQLTIYQGGGEEAMNAAADALNTYDRLFDYNKESSDIYRINNRTSDKVEISEDTFKLLQLGKRIREESGGALEPAIRPVSWLWDFKEEKKIPEETVLKKALSEVLGDAWEVEEEDGRWYFTAEDAKVKIDVGAIAKGFVADRIKDVMLENKVTSAIINLGGNVLCIGQKPDGSAFKIAIRDPRNESGYEHVLEVNDISAVTAGIYERYFEEDGVVYHHILDPKTGMPVQNGLLSVTVTGPESAVCDALCTAIFVKGEEEGQVFLDRYNQEHQTDYRVYFLK